MPFPQHAIECGRGRGRDASQSAQDDAVPPGHLREVMVWLEMTAPPHCRGSSAHLENLALMRAHQPALSFYRYLYNEVGENWLWHERRCMDDAALAAIIHDPEVRVSVLYCRGSPAGFAELDCRVRGEIELAYFGLLPEYTGRGLGRLLLERMIEQAWRAHPRRLWLHTCNLDSPGALGLYQKSGFVPYKQQIKLIPDPRIKGILPQSAAPHIPLTTAVRVSET